MCQKKKKRREENKGRSKKRNKFLILDLIGIKTLWQTAKILSKHILSMYFILISSWSRAKSWQISPNSGPSPCWTAVIPPVCQEPHLIFLKSTHPGDSGQWQQKETSWHVQKHGMWYQLQTHWTNFLFSQGILHMGLETNSRIFKSFLKV